MHCRHSVYKKIEFVSERLLKLKYSSDMESFKHLLRRAICKNNNNVAWFWWNLQTTGSVCKETMWHVSSSKERKGAKLRLQALGLNLDQNKSQVVNYEISRVNEPPSTNPQYGRSVEPEIRYLNYQNFLGCSDEISRPLAACANRQCSTFHHPRNGKAQRRSDYRL